MEKKVKFTAVGAGPCADLITVRGLRALRSADVILYDRLADSELLEGCSAEKVFVGKEPYKCSVRQDEINTLIEAYLVAGRHVARLKGGDSVIFSRVSEELAVARKAGAEVEIIPGVTAASAAAAKIECAMTDRARSSGVVYITGHLKGGLPDYDWHAIAANNFTVVVYMGAKYIRHIVKSLLAAGMDEATPLLAASDIEQETQCMRLLKASEIDEYTRTGSATVYIIGNVLKTAGIKAEELAGAEHE